MDESIREIAAKQGLGHIVALARCPSCNYIAKSFEEETSLARRDLPCPHCGVTGNGAGLAPNNYLRVANWIGEYAISDNCRDHASAVFLFCSFVEAILEKLKGDYLELHPALKSKFKPNRRLTFKDVFGDTFSNLLSAAPTRLKNLPSIWEELRDKRNRFLHGESSYLISRSDAYKAMDSTVDAVNVYRWLNNKHCLR